MLDHLHAFGLAVPGRQTGFVGGVKLVLYANLPVGYGLDNSLGSALGRDFTVGLRGPNGLPFIKGVAQ
jgi:hypothetical protein